MTDQNNNNIEGKPTIDNKTSRGSNLANLLNNKWAFAIILIIGGLIAIVAFSKSSAKDDEKASTDSRDKTSNSAFISYKPQPDENNIDDTLQSDAQLEKLEIPKEIEEEKVEEEKIEEEKIEDAVSVEPLEELPQPTYYDDSSSNGEKQLTREEKIFQSEMMSDGGKSQLYKDTNTAAKQDNNVPGQHYEGELTENLKSVNTPQVKATRIPPLKQNTTLAKGTFIPCTLKTRMDTTVPGLTTCIINNDVYSMDGKTLLIERGSNIIGEYTGAVQNGLERIFVLWTQIRTPKGITIDINSPAADQIGGAGMGGQVDHHWLKRFGSALLFSIVGDAFQFGINTANSNNTNGDVTYNQTSNAMNEIVKEAMTQAGNIPPTLIKNQGEKVGVTVARDVDFSSVYKLRYKYENYYN